LYNWSLFSVHLYNWSLFSAHLYNWSLFSGNIGGHIFQYCEMIAVFNLGPFVSATTSLGNCLLNQEI